MFLPQVVKSSRTMKHAVDYLKQYLKKDHSKTKLGKELPIVFPDKIKPLLANYIPLSGDRSCHYDMYAKALSKAGIRYLAPNCCRHTCASLLTKKGVPPAAIQRIMRHTSYKTTLGYTHMDSGDALVGVNQI